MNLMTEKNVAKIRITIRPYRNEDWEDMCSIHDRARLDELRGSVDPAAFLPLASTAEPEGLFAGDVWVACAEERVVGFVAAEDDEITWLYVHPDHYRCGIGRRLLRYAVERCGPVVTTQALAGNTPAIELYTSEGFEVAQTRTGKLSGNERFPATGVDLRLQKQ
jgi:GNAT superfamily N-acetyltransferase